MSNVTLYLALCDTVIDRPLSRKLRDRAAAISFGADVSFAETEEGEKPRFSHPEGAFFNVTHTKNLFCMAVSDSEVGIDAEVFPERLDRKRELAARLFGEEENAALADLEERAFSEKFARFWTRHEAAAKFSGEGLRAVFKGGEKPLVYTDLTELVTSLGVSAALTLCTEDVPSLTLDFLED